MGRIAGILAVMWLGFCGLAGGLAWGQTEVRGWSPYEETPYCIVSENYFIPSGGNYAFPGYTDEIMILKWYVSGAEFPFEVSKYPRKHFKGCFDGTRACGVPSNAHIAAKLGEDEFTHDAVTRAFFAAPPPQSAVRFAVGGVGDCFAEASTPADVEAAGLIETELPLDICYKAARVMQDYFEADAPAVTEAQAASFQGWARLIYHFAVGRNARPEPVPSVCPLVPREMLQGFFDYYDTHGYAAKETTSAQTRTAAGAAAPSEDAAVAQLKAYLYRELAARTDAQRFGTLSGCQIAYSYVYNGINPAPESFIVGRVPDGAIGWALDYEQSVIRNETCPAMPEALGEWMALQDPVTFTTPWGPFQNGKAGRGPVGGNANAWANFSQIWMTPYETVYAPDNGYGSDCDAAIWYAKNHRARPNDYERPADAAFKELVWLSSDDAAYRGMCTVVPKYMIGVARAAWSREQQRLDAAQARSQEIAAQRAKRATAAQRYNAALDAYIQNSQKWKPPVTTRCYTVQRTNWGKIEKCFTN